MHSISDERNWLTWLVKVRILILMVLLAIELAVIRLSPNPLPIMPFLTGKPLMPAPLATVAVQLHLCHA